MNDFLQKLKGYADKVEKITEYISKIGSWVVNILRSIPEFSAENNPESNTDKFE